MEERVQQAVHLRQYLRGTQWVQDQRAVHEQEDEGTRVQGYCFIYPYRY